MVKITEQLFYSSDRRHDKKVYDDEFDTVFETSSSALFELTKFVSESTVFIAN